MDKYPFEVEAKSAEGTEKMNVFGFGNSEQKAKEDVHYQLCQGSQIPKEDIKIVRLIDKC